jgi:hypothetical protein
MARIQIRVVMILIASLSFSAAAQIQEECMDCYEKVTKTPLPGGEERQDFEAECCDASCFYPNGFVVEDADVGWGCRTAQLPPSWGELHNWYGTVCNSSDDDLGCPEEPPPPPDEIQHNGSPIIIDLGEHSYRLTSIPGGVHFDLRNEGRRPQLAWTRLGVENAFLALDRNGNGRIDNGSELFGNYTPLRSGVLAQNGFVALAEFDSNSDRVVDSRDPAWQVLLLWTDRNHDGWSTPDEVQPIAHSMVIALGTEYRSIRKRDQWGNLFRYISKFRFRDGGGDHQRNYYDVFLQIAQ